MCSLGLRPSSNGRYTTGGPRPKVRRPRRSLSRSIRVIPSGRRRKQRCAAGLGCPDPNRLYLTTIRLRTRNATVVEKEPMRAPMKSKPTAHPGRWANMSLLPPRWTVTLCSCSRYPSLGLGSRLLSALAAERSWLVPTAFRLGLPSFICSCGLGGILSSRASAPSRRRAISASSAP
jgi:hypothetical protein